jgi:hypothetical protein
VEFQYCQREANSVTHEIARNSFQVNLSFISYDDPPSFVLPFFISDVCLIINKASQMAFLQNKKCKKNIITKKNTSQVRFGVRSAKLWEV